MRAYSNDLREKIVRAYENGEGSQRALARVFGVSEYFIKTLLRRWRETGSVVPKPHGGGRRPNIDQSGREHVRHIVKSDPDVALGELCERVKLECGQRSSVSAMCRLLQKLDLPRKKDTVRLGA
jgi:transposase